MKRLLNRSRTEEGKDLPAVFSSEEQGKKRWTGSFQVQKRTELSGSAVSAAVRVEIQTQEMLWKSIGKSRPGSQVCGSRLSLLQV